MRFDGGGAPEQLGRARSVLLVVALTLATALLVWLVNQHYPIRHWLFFIYLKLWAFEALFLLASLAIGWRLVRYVAPQIPLGGERVILAFALGVLTFGLGIFVAGIVGILHPVLFFAWPVLLLAAAGRTTFHRGWRICRRLRFRYFAPRTVLEAAIALFLVGGAVAVYLQIINPLHLGADTHWYHLSIAERYASLGHIRRFPEGSYLGAYPQLASLLYTWAFLAPGELFDHVQLASHTEYALFLLTLAGISVLTRRVLGGAREVRYAAAAIFTFPKLFLYDSSLLTSADHPLAFWGPPLALALFRFRDRFDMREAVLAGLVLGGAILTKYQSIYFVAASAVAVITFAVRRRRVTPLLLFGVVVLVLTSAHWLKNIVFYGDPIYPLMHRFLSPRPFHAGAAQLIEREYFHPLFSSHGPWHVRLVDALKAVVTFSFVPHDFPGFHGDRPVFGSLFTLLLPVLVFTRAPRRLWWLAGSVCVGVFVWYLTSHEDRFLQSLVPWMATSTAACLVLAWRSLRRGRVAVAGLVLLQVIDGSDVYFIRQHGMIGDNPLRSTVAHIAAGHSGSYVDRFRIWGDLPDIGQTLPKGSRVLMHYYGEQLGLGVPGILDHPGWQGGIEYLELESAARTIDLWRRFGATHVVWHAQRAPMSWEDWAREAVFARTVQLFGTGLQTVGSWETTTLSPAIADAVAGARDVTRIGVIGCGGDPPVGIYSPRGLAGGQPTNMLQDAALETDAAATLASAHAVLVRSGCKPRPAMDAELSRSFVRATSSSDVVLYIRR